VNQLYYRVKSRDNEQLVTDSDALPILVISALYVICKLLSRHLRGENTSH